ncbi:MAG TPA: LysM domain-containing protein [Candidatus Saccharimonadales bacterium]|nr:LysM domain-containing protein [Candidatus Saccharimonadales bacterium]
MTDRSQPVGGGAPACPFVAFDVDRDDRSERPDPAHRCYAESPPAPLSRAHQEAYCLAPAFPTCPVFQAWARREAARVRPSSPAADAAVRQRDADAWPGVVPSRELVRSAPDAGSLSAFEQALTGRPASVADPSASSASVGSRGPGSAVQDATDDEDLADLVGGGRRAFDEPDDRGSSAPGELSERRIAQQPWSAPPPWIQGGSAPADPQPGTPARGWQDTLSRPDRRLAPDADDPERDAAQAAVARRLQAGGSAPVDAAWLAAGGTAASAASGGRPTVERLSGPPRDVEPVDAAAPRRASGLAAILGWDRRPRAGSARAHRLESADPAWERPRRYEAYPTLRTRVGLPMPSRLAIAAVAIGVAALALFFLPPLLLPKNGGAGQPGPGNSASPTAAGSVRVSLPPATAAAPTPMTYTVKAGDTLSKIARKYGLTVDQLLAANKNIKNPNRIAIGDVIVIPIATPSVIFDGGASSSP